MSDDKTTLRRSARLGKGLSSLMAQPVAVATNRQAGHLQQPPDATTDDLHHAGEGLIELPVGAIQPNPHQPRKQFDQVSLEQLAHSIKADGLMQPIIVRPIADAAVGGATHELVAGERRWRAARLAGIDRVPAIVRELSDRQMAEWALIENLQREDLNPMDRAEAFSHLIDRFSLSHEEVADRVGMNRTTITNFLRLLTLPEDVQQLIRDGLLSAGQAKALISINDADFQRKLAISAVKEDLSVRQVEALVRRAADSAGGGATPAAARKARRDAHLSDLEKQINQQLGTKTRITPGRKKGTGSLTLEFFSLDQFEDILRRLGVKME